MRHKMPIVFLVSAFLSAFLAPHAEAVPTVPATGLEVQITESGKISLSADGAGSNAVDGITIQVNKPNAAATVRSAFFACASLGGRVINDGDVSLDGNPITWAASVQNNAGGDLTFFTNVFANVTAIVKPRVDAAVPGLVDFTQTEVNTDGIDGCALHVVFDDPSQTTDNTVFILFGGQNTDGDNFAVTLAQPLSGSDRAEMGLGISFSLQPSAMFSQIDVNAVRLTTSAGGQDDGADPNGALLTVGGIDDSTANPADPNAPPAGDPRIDDELYDLRPFVGPSDTDIFVQTLNPTDDDNIFAGHIFVTKPAIVGEGIVLTQSSSISPVGTPHTVTALVVNDLGQAVSGRVVDFQVISGPNAGTSNSGTTNANGEASFTYTGTSSAGTDVIVARFIDSTGNRQTSNKLQKTWVMRGEGIVLTQSSSISPVGTPHTVTALVVNDLSQAVSGRVVDFQVISGPNAGTSNSGTTNANGEASFTYTGTGSVGTDAIVARFIDSTGNPRRSNEVQKMWVLDVPNPRGGAPLSCRGATCSIPLTCPLSPALGISCINEARVLVARRFLPRRSARSSTDTAAKARRRMIVFASGIANIPPAATQDVPLRRTRTGKQIARSGRRKLVGVIEIRSSAGTSISSTPVTIRIRRR